MLRLKIHISSCQTTLSYFETRCDTAMISDSLVGRLNISAQQIMVKVGSHEDVIRSTSVPAMIPQISVLSRVSLTSASSEHVRTSGSNVKEQFTSTIYRFAAGETTGKKDCEAYTGLLKYF